ncbi:hypothetical protein ACQKWADRAFT_295252 [Trichoderma austrokoningii]
MAFNREDIQRIASEPASSVAEEAFQAALTQLTKDDDQGKHAKRILQDAASLQDIQAAVSKSMHEYQIRGKSPKTTRWLHRAAKSIVYYSNVFDVFVPHNAQYASLAWGAMNFLFSAAMDYEKTTQLLAKSISQIAESLPRAHLSSGLYPTPEMKTALEDLYASVLGFLMKAYEWFNEGKLSHILHGVSQRWHSVNADLVDEIAEKSRRIDQLAAAASQAELRDMHGKIAAIQSQMQLVVASRGAEPRDMDQIFAFIQSQQHLSTLKMDDILKQMSSYHAIQSSTMLDTNQRVSDLQMSQILTHLSNVPLDDPLKSFQHHLFFRKRRAQGSSLSAVTNPFWLSSRFQSLFSTDDSALALIKGNLATRQVLQDFCVDVIEHLRSSNIPTLWALKKVATPDDGRIHLSIVDLLKYLIFQALQLNESLKTEKTMAWRCAQFQRATTPAELFQLLLAALDGLGRQIYLLIDLDTVEEALQSFDGFNIMSAFLQSFQASQSPNTRLKIIIIRYRAGEMQLDSHAALAVVPVRAIGRGRQQGKETLQKVKAAVRRGITKQRCVEQ